jgi:hypothetical protein
MSFSTSATYVAPTLQSAPPILTGVSSLDLASGSAVERVRLQSVVRIASIAVPASTRASSVARAAPRSESGGSGGVFFGSAKSFLSA